MNVFLVCLLGCIALTRAQLDCPTLPPHDTPTNISYLRPSDIKVIMTLGDSVTAGFGMEGASGYFNEFRGQSWSIGGDPNATTVGNFLKLYNPDIQGQSLGSHVIEFCYNHICPPDQYRPAEDVLNCAQSGAMVDDLVTHEFTYLMTQLIANPKIDMKNDWKLMTIFIGGNDLCASCKKQFLDPSDFEANLAKTLEEVRMNIPRVFVQIVEIFNLSQIYDLSLKTPECVDIHRVLYIECDCIFARDANATRLAVDEYAQAYNERSRTLAAYYQKQNYSDFTVVVQPFGGNTAIRDMPPALLSTLDCFHPSLLGHQWMAIALWNNMLTPAAYKKTSMNISDTPLCPTAETLLYTY